MYLTHLARQLKVNSKEKNDPQTQGNQGQPKSIEKNSLKNTSVNIKTKPNLNIKNGDKSNRNLTSIQYLCYNFQA